MAAFEHLAPSISCWGAQLYRGRSFGGFLGEFEAGSRRALIVTEYGVDSYDDSECERSWEDVCEAAVNPEQMASGEQMQADWDVALAQELMAHSPRNVRQQLLIFLYSLVLAQTQTSCVLGVVVVVRAVE